MPSLSRKRSVEFSTEKLAGLGIDRGEVIAALRAQNAVNPAGDLQTGDEKLALRVSGEYQRDAGYINYTNVVERQTGSPLSVPLLANPSDVAGSPGIRTTVDGANWSDNYGGRAFTAPHAST